MTAQSPGGRVRIASYNVRGLKDDRDALVRVVRDLAPDVLLLQEVPRHPLSGHRIAGLADQLGLTWFGDRRFRMSTTVMTSLRLDVLGAHHGSLPTRRFDEPRGYGMATVRLPGHRPFVVCSVHLSLREEDRPGQVAALLEAVRSQPSAAVLGGDLNEEPTGAAWRMLAEAMPAVSGDAATFPADAPRTRIDAVFASAPLRGSVPALDASPALLAAASDHRPVVVDLEVAALGDGD